MKVRFRDLSTTDQALKTKLMNAVERVLDHGQLIGGPEIEQFEEEFAKRCDREYCIGVGSGTSALYLALRATDIGAGDEVITTPLSWISTLQAIIVCGAKPVFADIGKDLNIDAGQVEALITPYTKAIVPVHFNGRICDLPRLREIADRRQLRLIEDAAQAFGAQANGQIAGSVGDLAAFSLNPMKNPAGYGEAGAVVTNDAALRDRLLRLRQVGMGPGEVCLEPSLNFKMDALQAALIGVSMTRTADVTRRRIEIAHRYTEQLLSVVECPEKHHGHDLPSVYFDYPILADKRDSLKVHLEACGIEVKIKHTPLMPDQPAFKGLLGADVPVAREAIKRLLNLPIHEKLTNEEVDYVAECVRGFYSA